MNISRLHFIATGLIVAAVALVIVRSDDPEPPGRELGSAPTGEDRHSSEPSRPWSTERSGFGDPPLAVGRTSRPDRAVPRLRERPDRSGTESEDDQDAGEFGIWRSPREIASNTAWRKQQQRIAAMNRAASATAPPASPETEQPARSASGAVVSPGFVDPNVRDGRDPTKPSTVEKIAEEIPDHLEPGFCDS